MLPCPRQASRTWLNSCHGHRPGEKRRSARPSLAAEHLVDAIGGAPRLRWSGVLPRPAIPQGYRHHQRTAFQFRCPPQHHSATACSVSSSSTNPRGGSQCPRNLMQRRRHRSAVAVAWSMAMKAGIGATACSVFVWPLSCWRCTRCRSASDDPDAPSNRMALVIALVFASAPVARAQDTARPRAEIPTGTSAQAHGLAVSLAAWPAPVGHRQPRAEDIPAEAPKKRDSDAQLERLDRALDGKLKICRGC